MAPDRRFVPEMDYLGENGRVEDAPHPAPSATREESPSGRRPDLPPRPRPPHEVRRVAHLMYRVGNDAGLLAFCLSDTHLHCLAQGSRADAGALTRRLEIALSRTLSLSTRFEHARIRPVNGLDHLQNALFYLFRQSSHHGTRFDPHMEGSSLVDVLGLRRIGAQPTTERLCQALPRLTHAQLRPLLRLDRSVEPATADLLEAASAAIAAPHLRGKTQLTREARRALAHLLQDKLTPTSLARTLGLSRLGRRSRRQGDSERLEIACPPDPSLLFAIEQFARLRASRARENAWLSDECGDAVDGR